MKRVRVNRQIRAPLVRTIDHEGKQVGVMEVGRALLLARAQKLDLVEVAPKLNPPVCKIMDYGKYHYNQMKKLRHARKKQMGIKLKEIKVRPRIEEHDYGVKLRHARDFLSKGCKLRIRLIFRGRELAHKELGDNVLNRLKEDLKDVGYVEMPPRRFGRNVVMMFGPATTSKGHHEEDKNKEENHAENKNEQGSSKEIQNNEEGQG